MSEWGVRVVSRSCCGRRLRRLVALESKIAQARGFWLIIKIAKVASGVFGNSSLWETLGAVLAWGTKGRRPLTWRCSKTNCRRVAALAAQVETSPLQMSSATECASSGFTSTAKMTSPTPSVRLQWFLSDRLKLILLPFRSGRNGEVLQGHWSEARGHSYASACLENEGQTNGLLHPRGVAPGNDWY